LEGAAREYAVEGMGDEGHRGVAAADGEAEGEGDDTAAEPAPYPFPPLLLLLLPSAMVMLARKDRRPIEGGGERGVGATRAGMATAGWCAVTVVGSEAAAGGPGNQVAREHQ
jgi:hypothetical protein